MQDTELIAFQIISAVGAARSAYIEAVHMAREGDFQRAAKLIARGDEVFHQGHDAHMQLLQRQGEGKKDEMDLLLVHAEDQLMSAESFKILAEEFIEVYKQIQG